MPCSSPANVRGFPITYLTPREFRRMAVPFVILQMYSFCNETGLLVLGCIYFLYGPLFFGLNMFHSFSSFHFPRPLGSTSLLAI